jgi:hypothetical protein
MLFISLSFALEIPLQGYVTGSDGAPISGAQTVTVRLFSDADGTQERHEEQQSVLFTEGTFATNLGVASPLTAAFFETWSDLWVSVQVGDGAPSAPVALARAPYAAVADRARDAALLDGQDSSAFAAASHTHAGSYVSLTGSYADPSWLVSLAASKIGWSSQGAGQVLVAPADAAGLPTFRRLSAADIGSGTPTASSVLRGDGTWGPPPRLGEDNTACSSDHAGAMRLRGQRFLDICSNNGTSWAWTTIVSGGNDGSSPSLAATSCKAILDAGLSTGDKAYFIQPTPSVAAVQTWCDMTNGGWTLIAKFSNTGDWTYTNANWTSTSTLNTALLANTTAVGSAKAPAFNVSAFTQLRMDETGVAPATGKFVTFNNASEAPLQQLFASGTAYSLTITAGALTNFSARDSNFQGTAGNKSNTLRMNGVGGNTFTWPACETVQNRVRLGSNYGCNGCGGDVNGGANSAFIGVGGSTLYRDAHAGSCANYATSGESAFDTSGENINLWGR